MATKEALPQGEVESLLNELENKMSRLRTIYEQYFLGIERMPPNTLRKDVFRMVQRLENVYIRNTAQKFRLRSLVQRFNSYKTYWSRIERQIEEGTYQRDINRANRRQMRQQPREQEDGMPILELDLEMEVDLEEIQAEMEELDAAGAFDSHTRRGREPQMPSREPQVPSREPAKAEMSDAEKEELKRRKIEELRRQLLSGEAPSPPARAAEPAPAPAPVRAAATPQAASAEDEPMDERQAKLARLKQRLGTSARVEPVASTEDNVERQNRIAAARERVQSAGSDSGPQRVIERPSAQQRTIQRPTANQDDPARRVFNELIETKKKLNESTAGLTYESVKTSMAAQTEQLKQSRGAKDVDFKVVVKDGKAFLKPQTK